MKSKRLICLLLALALMLVCLSGCRGRKEAAEQTEEPEVIEVVPPAGQEGLTVDENPMVIEIPEDSELGGEELP